MFIFQGFSEIPSNLYFFLQPLLSFSAKLVGLTCGRFETDKVSTMHGHWVCGTRNESGLLPPRSDDQSDDSADE